MCPASSEMAGNRNGIENGNGIKEQQPGRGQGGSKMEDEAGQGGGQSFVLVEAAVSATFCVIYFGFNSQQKLLRTLRLRQQLRIKVKLLQCCKFMRRHKP